MRRLLLLLCLIGSALLVDASPARACLCERSSDEELFAMASSVFVAHVFRSEEATGLVPLLGDKPETIVEASFRTVEVLKGQPPPSGKMKALTWSSSCSVLLYPAVDYLIFLRDDDFVLPCAGSRSISLEGHESVTTVSKSLLQRLRALPRQEK
jgi:hypothetical protein